VLSDDHQEAWRQRERDLPVEPELTFQDVGLVLGAGTVLAPATEVGGKRSVCLDDAEPRLAVLLAAAYGRDAGQGALRHIRRAASRWNAGDDVLASVHLAMTGLGRMPDQRRASHRLFLADCLLEAGIQPQALLRALDLGPLRRYDPDQPRVPAGGGRTSGQWTSDGSSATSDASTSPTRASYPNAVADAPVADVSGSASAPSAQDAAVDALSAPLSPSDLEAARQAALKLVEQALSSSSGIEGLSPEGLTALAALSRLISVPTIVLGVLLTPTNSMVEQRHPVPRVPDTFYERYPGEIGWHVVTKNINGDDVEIPSGPDGFFRDPWGRPFAKVLPNGQLVFDASGDFPPAVPHDDREPSVCPVPTPDKDGGGPASFGRAYEDFMKFILNPGRPTPSGFGRELPNPDAASGKTIFDDCWLKDGTMFEYKGGYAGLVRLAEANPSRWTFVKDWLDQSERQLQAAKWSNRPIVWTFSSGEAAQFAYDLFKRADKGRENITIAVFPFLGG
jgi:hypothetical protein